MDTLNVFQLMNLSLSIVGGRGVKGMGVHKDDFIEQLISSSTHDMLLFFTNSGKVYSMKGYEVPEYGRAAQGIPIINLLGINNKRED